MNRTVHFADRSVVFASEPPTGAGAVILGPDAPVTRDKVVKILETANSVVILSADPDAAFAAFAAEFTPVEAAGGIVRDEAGRWLMIRRNGRWDLPKGHVECGECLEACAEREILEETGIRARVERALCTTLHAYYFPSTSRWELKRTHWFLLLSQGGDPEPQTDEGIERVAWCPPEAVAARAAACFPSVREVLAAARQLRPAGR